MNENNKVDMSGTCDFRSAYNWYNAYVSRTMPMDEYYKWYEEHCAKCIYGHDICMYGEE